MRLRAEVSGRLQKPKSCRALLYAPFEGKATFLRSRCYELEFEGESAVAEGFVRKVLVDEIGEEARFGESPAFDGWTFCLEYGMKPTALDLEKEAVLNYYREVAGPEFRLKSLWLTQRLYVFSKADGSALSADSFVRDVVNPAIHTWTVTHGNGD